MKAGDLTNGLYIASFEDCRDGELTQWLMRIELPNYRLLYCFWGRREAWTGYKSFESVDANKIAHLDSNLRFKPITLEKFLEDNFEYLL
jgi:hypothetical protein